MSISSRSLQTGRKAAATLLAGLCLALGLWPAWAEAVKPPKLIVVLIIDGLPQRQVMQYRDHLSEDGFRRFLDRGLWFSEAHYGHAHTVTAAGHAVLMTGAYPQRTGIIGNDWIDPTSRQRVYNTQDSGCQYIGHATESLAGTSARLLLTETVGDVLRSVDAASKVVGISGKDRGAILPAGHKGLAYMYMSSTGQFASSTCYMNSHPEWVKGFNAAKPADAYFGKTWAPLLPESAYERSVADGQIWQSTSGNGNKLPAVIGAQMPAPNPNYYENLLATPFGDELTLNFAQGAIEGEQLGADGKPDILTISLSSHDYVNHAFGPESRLSHDHLLHLDRHLQAFFKYLDQHIGADQYLAVLTADHGFGETPEWAASQGRDAKRISSSKQMARANEELAKLYGAGPWITHSSAMGVLFDEALIKQRDLKPDQVYDSARSILLQDPDVAAVYTRQQLLQSDDSSPIFQSVRKTWHAERSPPVMVVLKPGRIYGSRPTGSSHGTPHRYDTHVPLMMWGPNWVRSGEVGKRVELADLAPTLAAILSIPVPQQSQGKLLPLTP